MIIPYCYLQCALPRGSALPNKTSHVLERPKPTPKIKVLTRELLKYITDCLERDCIVQVAIIIVDFVALNLDQDISILLPWDIIMLLLQFLPIFPAPMSFAL